MVTIQHTTDIFGIRDFDLGVAIFAKTCLSPFASLVSHCWKITIGNSSRVVDALVTELPCPRIQRVSGGGLLDTKTTRNNRPTSLTRSACIKANSSRSPTAVSFPHNEISRQTRSKQRKSHF